MSFSCHIYSLFSVLSPSNSVVRSQTAFPSNSIIAVVTCYICIIPKSVIFTSLFEIEKYIESLKELELIQPVLKKKRKKNTSGPLEVAGKKSHFF